ncbi:MAG: molybdopterin-dependent oxidoreductase, partial [Magnetospirillum sp.]|nr:molybdopterin-dependent oxidoreductase [Magnetospirillum sp.]
EHEGLKAVDLFQAIDSGRVKAVWIMATNPAVSLPDAEAVRRALAKCPVVIVSDCVADTDTLRYAHIRLPALAWGEKDGTVTNSERTVSRQRPFLPAPGEARADWWMVAEEARALGFGPAFAWSGPAAIFAEHAALSRFENHGARALAIDAADDYETLAPAPWAGQRLFADGRFFTADGRARLVPVRHRPPAEPPAAEFPLLLNTGRTRDHWHTMTRTGLSPRLCGHRSEPLLDLHPADSRRFGIPDGALVRVESRLGAVVARARLTEAQQPGEVFLPMHWNDRFASCAVVGRLLAAHTDPLSGQPEAKCAPVRLRRFETTWSGLLISTGAPALDGPSWWVRHPIDGAEVTEMAGGEAAERERLVAALDAAFGSDRLEVVDAGRGIARYAWMAGERLLAALFLAPDRPEVVRGWIGRLIGGTVAAAGDRAAILAGRAPAGQADAGATVCACFAVGLATIETLIREQRVSSVEDIGAAVKAGTGCGSCVPELKALLAAGFSGEILANGVHH